MAASATNYVVEPSLTGHTFAPATISVAVTVNARLSNNFTATAVGPIQVLRANLLTATVGDGTAPQVKLAFGIALGGGGGAFELFVNGTSTGFAQCEVDSSAGEIIWTLPSGSLRAGDVVSVKLHGFADEHGNALLESAGPVVAQ